MIQFAIYILTNHAEALDKWQRKCQYVLCDEYQDVNANQDLLLTLLSGKYHNLTVVGDDDQCIYGWRGSEVDFIADTIMKSETGWFMVYSEKGRLWA